MSEMGHLGQDVLARTMSCLRHPAQDVLELLFETARFVYYMESPLLC